MSNYLLKSLDVVNFRSIRGHVHAPLDAQVVLLHGENGAGKTSLLSAIELALTGGVQSLQRADPSYVKQLLHRSATQGSVSLKAVAGETESSFGAVLTGQGSQTVASLSGQLASFFRERVFLPQSMLGQLLQIYQDAGNDAVSPLAQFVGKLLGLDRLDALEAGLKVLADVRNVRKAVDGWLPAENERTRLDRQMADQRKMRDALGAQIRTAVDELVALCATLGLPSDVRADALDAVSTALSNTEDVDAFARLSDQQRKLGSIQRELEEALGASASDATLPAATDDASKEYLAWDLRHGGQIHDLRRRIELVLPNASLPADLDQLAVDAIGRLRVEQKQLSERVSQARVDIARFATAQDERNVSLRQRDALDEELARLSNTSGALASALAELSSFITDDVCPVCDRDYGETDAGSLAGHVHSKVRALSGSAERLITLGRTRGETQVTVDRLVREIELLAARRLEEAALAELDRRLAQVDALVVELDGATNLLREGARLRAADIAWRRTLSAAQSRSQALAAGRETLNDFAVSAEASALGEGETIQGGASRLLALLEERATKLEKRLALRRSGTDLIATIRSASERRDAVETRIAADSKLWSQLDGALERAQALRDQGNTIRSAVDSVRSSIIRREFNERLNRVWRDLFVRLAPGEPFVPAFRIPATPTQRLQPKLITEHRDGGDAGGTPGAMLSAGNLNTAALTLFTALHLSVPRELPWLILDDPVQSMDDVHISHFAALLRTLSKEHGRQIMIAVHDRQLFEYLKLELSPAFPEDSLLTLELSRGARRDSVCIPQRFSFRQEPSLLAA